MNILPIMLMDLLDTVKLEKIIRPPTLILILVGGGGDTTDEELVSSGAFNLLRLFFPLSSIMGAG